MRTRFRSFVALVLFGIGISVGWVLAKGSAVKTDPASYHGKEPKAAAEALLQIAAGQAGDDTWQNIAIGRVYYLTGDKEKGESFFQKATAKKPGKDDYQRISRVYAEAKEWDKAETAMKKGLAMDPKDESYQAELGAILNLKGERASAESQFDTSFKQKPDEFWNTINAAGSYVGVRPQ
jgi:tetratricopeptide (TPR) repeat protein